MARKCRKIIFILMISVHLLCLQNMDSQLYCVIPLRFILNSGYIFHSYSLICLFRDLIIYSPCVDKIRTFFYDVDIV